MQLPVEAANPLCERVSSLISNYSHVYIVFVRQSFIIFKMPNQQQMYIDIPGEWLCQQAEVKAMFRSNICPHFSVSYQIGPWGCLFSPQLLL